jgi:hypothetical protein
VTPSAGRRTGWGIPAAFLAGVLLMAAFTVLRSGDVPVDQSIRRFRSNRAGSAASVGHRMEIGRRQRHRRLRDLFATFRPADSRAIHARKRVLDREGLVGRDGDRLGGRRLPTRHTSLSIGAELTGRSGKVSATLSNWPYFEASSAGPVAGMVNNRAFCWGELKLSQS